jgi:hypothetical protein
MLTGGGRREIVRIEGGRDGGRHTAAFGSNSTGREREGKGD